jgi:hypothetical protein
VLLEVDSQPPTDIWLEEKEAVMFPRQLTKSYEKQGSLHLPREAQ